MIIWWGILTPRYWIVRLLIQHNESITNHSFQTSKFALCKILASLLRNLPINLSLWILPFRMLDSHQCHHDSSLYVAAAIQLAAVSATQGHCRALHFFNDCYAPDRESRRSPAISSSFTELAHFLPMTAIITCEGDPLRSAAAQLSDKIQRGKKSLQDMVLHNLERV